MARVPTPSWQKYMQLQNELRDYPYYTNFMNAVGASLPQNVLQALHSLN